MSLMNDLESARREAIRVLCRAQAADRISVEGFENRLEQINHAPNQATLAAILADLEEENFPVPEITGSRAVAMPDRTLTAAAVSPAEFLRIASIFGSTKRAGSWTVPLLIQVKVLFGEAVVDLRDAVFGADFVDIDVDVKLGSFSLIVPAGTQVENEIEETLTGSTHSTRSARGARPNGLLVRLRGTALLATVDIKERFPTKPGGGGLLDRLLKAADS